MLNTIRQSILAAGLLLLSANAYAKGNVGELSLEHDGSSNTQAVLLNTDISGNVNGLIASIKVKQTFQNNMSEWVNGRYVFPLPEGAAVDSFRMRIGERVIDGLIKEKEAAIKAFKAAKKSGKKAGLLNQHRPNLFSISVANIGPNEEVVTELTFINKVGFQDDTFSLTLPTTITPRYISNLLVKPKEVKKQQKELEQSIQHALSETQHVEIDSASGWANGIARIIDTYAITPSQTHSVGTQASHNFSLALSINAGLQLQEVVSDTHAISNHYLSNNNVEVSLSNTIEKMDSDVVIQWQATLGKTPQAAFFQQEFNKAYYSMLMVTPPQVNSSLSLPRDVTFVIDTSGSMSGVSMRQAKQALHNGLDYLSSNDKFNIIEFNSSFSSLYPQSAIATNTTLSQAHAMVDQLEAGGGTEMFAPLKHVLNNQQDSNYLSQIIFITDGSINNESALFELIKNNLNNARLFTVAIGSAPNHFFMEKAAQFGRGTSTAINKLDQVNQQMAALFEKITSPVMRDLEVSFPQTSSVEIYPSVVPDLYKGQPLTLIVKSDKPITQANIEGQLVNTPWKQTLNLTSRNRQNTDNLDTVWARQKVAALMDQLRTGERNHQDTKSDVVSLGIEHNIVTKYTSFIAIEQTVSRPAEVKAKQQNVPNLIPKGNTMPAPATATPATLLSLLGAFLILLSAIGKRINALRRFICAMPYIKQS